MGQEGKVVYLFENNMEKTCENCGEIAKKYGGKFCGKVCAGEFISRKKQVVNKNCFCLICASRECEFCGHLKSIHHKITGCLFIQCKCKVLHLTGQSK